MPLRFFSVLVCDPRGEEQELNDFVAQHRVVSIERHFIDQGSNSMWAICVDYLDNSQSTTSVRSNNPRGRIDYKTVLSPEEFATFSRLRDVRKDLAQQEAVPVYALFTNEQLAVMIQRRCRTASDLVEIEGLGESKVQKYVDKLLPVLQELKVKDDAQGEPPVRSDF